MGQKKNIPCIVEGIRTPFVKAGKQLHGLSALELGRRCITELLYRSECHINLIDHVIIGIVAQPAEVSNIARVISLASGISPQVPALTVQRNCASGMQAIINASEQIELRKCKTVICGAVESVSNIPLKTNHLMSEFYAHVSTQKSLLDKIKAFRHFRPEFFQPVVSLAEYLKDGFSSLSMGQTAEIIAKKWRISRTEQDEWSLASHKKATEALQNNIFTNEIFPIFIGDDYQTVVNRDLSIRQSQSMEKLRKLRPYYDREAGTVTRGNMAPLADGAVSLLIMNHEKAVQEGFMPDFRISHSSVAATDPEEMGLAPLYALKKLLKQARLSLDQVDLLEINEVFAAHVLAIFKVLENSSKRKEFFLPGKLDPDHINVNGGAIAIGHSLSSSSARIVLHLMKELQRRHLSRGIATSPANGGQALAIMLERI